MVLEVKNSKEKSLNGLFNRFIYGLKAPESQRQYPKRLEVFLNFMNIDGLDLPEKLTILIIKPNLIFNGFRIL
jgi:hypothetical protein